MRWSTGRREAAAAAALYLLVALATSWPLARGLNRDLPWDLGDPVLNCALLERNAQRLLAGLGGDASALRGFWDARIFHPEPLTLAYSEHLFAESLQILPLYALSRNILLCYNLLFLSTFVLSGLGAFLLARELTGRLGPALLAGLCFGFAPYRVEQLSHLQVLSAQWLPFALLGLWRHLETRRLAPLAWGALALLAQNLSCGYYLLFFTPVVLGFVVQELARRGRLRDTRSWLRLGLAGLVVVLGTLPFLLPYLELRERGGLRRELAEVELFSADVYAYLTAPEELRFWGERLRAFPAPEGQLFPGAVPLLLTALGVALPLLGRARPAARLAGWRRLVAGLGLALLGAELLAATLILLGGGGFASSLIPGLSLRSLPRALWLSAAGLGLWLAASAAARTAVARALASTRAYWALALVAAVALSFGPTLRSLGRPLMSGPYLLLYQAVPGFDGLRVPSRFAMIVALMLALLAGFGAAEIAARRRGSAIVLSLCALLFLAESTAAPLLVNDVWAEPGLRRPASRLSFGAAAPAIYRRAAELPRDSVLVEFPFGSDPYELRYMFHQAVHGLPLVNGFSGQFPASYAERRGPLRNLLAEPERAWRALAGSTATHAIVHEGAWGIPAKGRRVTRWLEERGAIPLAQEGSDVLLRLPR